MWHWQDMKPAKTILNDGYKEWHMLSHAKILYYIEHYCLIEWQDRLEGLIDLLLFSSVFSLFICSSVSSQKVTCRF